MSATPDLLPIIREACKWNTAAWMEGFGKIMKKNGDIVKPVCNEYQRKLSEVIEWAHDNGRPCRIIALKPRQKGSSTFSVAALYNRLKAKRARGLIAGGNHFQGESLFKILRVYAQGDELDPGFCKVMDMEARFKNGSEMQRLTLATTDAGRSGTFQALCVTECAYLSEQGVANADVVLDGLMKCVPYEAETIIIMESTANGASGRFYDDWQNSITFEQFKNGSNGKVAIFSPWFEFDDSRMPPESEGIESLDDLDDEEYRYAKRWDLDLEQAAWMRWAIREQSGGDWDKFKQDYPSDPDTAFLKSGRGCFSQDGLAYQEERVVPVAQKQFGVLEQNDKTGRVSFRPTDEQEATVVRFEAPKVGCGYIQSTDPATGDSQTSGEDPDSNAFGVLRKGYLAADNRWHEPAVVMRNIYYKDGTRFGNWWDTDIVEHQAYLMAKYYGGCRMVVETNKDRGIIELLKLRGDADIYAREMFNKRTQQQTNALGWETNSKTREMIITTLKRAIREAGQGKTNEGIELNCPWIVSECRSFVIKPNGRSEAASGKHDDSVLFVAFGLQCIDQATTYNEPKREVWIPPEIRGREVQRKVGRAECG